ncbi:TonB-dependent receptor plug domain-containing protein [Winogradskyella sp.]|uniref:TonB-dependent receptor plug domain-containing protein n=1 Tax=Winogradskyella sp. TaxID=1883156 RepID=UPI002606BA91|nr:TonB-dependent receptor plug domain-containing protein [Winogradskyella sp.]
MKISFCFPSFVPNQAFAKFFLIISFSSISSLSGFGNKVLPSYLEETPTTVASLITEKVYIHFDRSNYYAEEDIWFKVYLIDAITHWPALSQVVHLDLISPLNTIVDSKTVKIDNGFGEGDFSLPFDIYGGEYTVRAYTNYMRNFGHSCFFHKKLIIHSPYHPTENLHPIPSTKMTPDGASQKGQKLDIQFFPEGGHMVNGFTNRVGFKVTNQNGMGVDLEGEIVDASNQEITSFETSKFGMGTFQLIPNQGQRYRAKIMHNGVVEFYNLPACLNMGATLQIVDHGNHYRANIQSSLSSGINSLKLFGKQRNGIVYSSQIVGDGSVAIVKVPKDILQQGIVQFTLFDGNENPLAERLVFFEGEGTTPKVNISPSKNEYNKKELVTLDISLEHPTSTKKMANTSLAVTKISENATQLGDYDIKTYLLLNSEIQGNIENPYYYFNSSDPQRRKNLDILMMTQGWRQFIDIDDTIYGREPNNKFELEKGITLKGTVKSSYNRDKPVMALVSLSYKNSQEVGFDEVKTNAQGRFVFKDLNFIDTTSVILQAKNINASKSLNSKKKQGLRSDFFIEMDSVIPPPICPSINLHSAVNKGDLNDYVAGSSKNFETTFLTDKDVVQLEEVEVKSKKLRPKDRYVEKRILYKEASQTIDFQDIPVSTSKENPLMMLQGRIPGFSIWNGDVYLRGSSTLRKEDSKALILLNGTPVEDALTIQSMPFTEIDFIDVLKGPRTAIYGSRAGGGIVAIYTKSFSKKKISTKVINSGTINFTHSGFSHARKFYEPVYHTNKLDIHTPNPKSSVLSWRPTVIIKEGKASISFYSSNKSGAYQVILEGITYEGDPLVSRATFEVR